MAAFSGMPGKEVGMDPAKHYKPHQRLVRATVLTGGGWIEGTFHLPPAQGFAEFLSHGEQFYSLTNVKLNMHPPLIPFFALARTETILVVPREGEPNISSAPQLGEMIVHPVLCLCPNCSLQGTVRILKGMRLSDLIVRTTGFLLVENCRAETFSGYQVESCKEVSVPFILVNAARLVGISESKKEE